MKDGYGYVSLSGKFIIKPGKYEEIKSFSDGMSLVMKNGKYGFVDANGKLAVKLKYDMANDFNNGFACVLKKKHWYLIDKNGKEVHKIK